MLKLAKFSAEEGLDAARTVVNAKSLEDVVHAESKYLQKHLTASIDACWRKLVEICAETARNAMEPITRGLSTAAKKDSGFKGRRLETSDTPGPDPLTSPGPGVKLEEGQHECARKVDVAEKELHDPRVSKGRRDVMSFYRAAATIGPLRIKGDGEGVGLPRKVASGSLLLRSLMQMGTSTPVIKVGSAASLLLAGRAF